MRYPQGGGLTAERQAFREHIRLQAAELFAAVQGNAAVARELHVSVRSARWRRAWEDGGERALALKGPLYRPKFGEALFAVLEQELAKGPVAHGWPDRTWTLSRIKTLIGAPVTTHPDETRKGTDLHGLRVPWNPSAAAATREGPTRDHAERQGRTDSPIMHSRALKNQG